MYYCQDLSSLEALKGYAAIMNCENVMLYLITETKKLAILLLLLLLENIAIQV